LTILLTHLSSSLPDLLKFADKKDTFGFKDELERNQCLQWVFFWHGSGAPYQGKPQTPKSIPIRTWYLHFTPGQTNHFTRAAPEKIPYAIERFRNETLRVYGVLEIQLSGKYTGTGREYLAGNGKGKYSVADIKTWPWVKGWEKSGFTEEDMKPFPHLRKWVDRIAERDAVQRGIGEGYNLKKWVSFDLGVEARVVWGEFDEWWGDDWLESRSLWCAFAADGRYHERVKQLDVSKM
jgi:glutathione S-transferase